MPESNPNNEPVIFVVDDDDGVRESLKWLLESVGAVVRCFASAENFLEEINAEDSGCLVLDIRMPGMSGLELQIKLIEKEIALPVIFVTAHADVPVAIQAMKRGAFDFIEKPYSDQLLLEKIQDAIHSNQQLLHDKRSRQEVEQRLSKLSVREREVFDQVIAGNQNKDIARNLNLSIKTVEAHRANLQKKLGVQATAELFHIAASARLI